MVWGLESRVFGLWFMPPSCMRKQVAYGLQRSPAGFLFFLHELVLHLRHSRHERRERWLHLQRFLVRGLGLLQVALARSVDVDLALSPLALPPVRLKFHALFAFGSAVSYFETAKKQAQRFE